MTNFMWASLIWNLSTRGRRERKAEHSVYQIGRLRTFGVTAQSWACSTGNTRRMRFAVAIAATVLLLSACAADPTPAPADPAVAVQGPAQVFGGDCGALFSDADVSSAAGQSLAATTVSQGVQPGRLMVDEAGGLRCGWASADFSAIVYLIALPAAVVTAPELSDCGAILQDINSCAIDVTSADMRVSGIVASRGADDATLLNGVATLESLFTSHADASQAVASSSLAPGAWTTPADCAAILKSVDFAARFGVSDSFSVIEGGDTAPATYFALPIESALWGDRSSPTCSIGSDNPAEFYGLDFSVLGGGAWALDTVKHQPGATVAQGDDLGTVVLTPDGVNTTIDIFTGVNWLQTRAAEPDAMYALLGEIVAALDAAA